MLCFPVVLVHFPLQIGSLLYSALLWLKLMRNSGNIAAVTPLEKDRGWIGICGKEASYVPIIFVQNAVTKGAVCLDGSAPTYHLDRGFEEGINNWLVQFEELRCFQTVTCYQVVVNNLEDAHEILDTAISTALKESKPVYISISCNLAAIPHQSPHFQLSNQMELQAAVKAAADFHGNMSV
ncbi:hypothetical protein HN51_030967 [Arachis hypogaea]